jgi:hypothetical protein
MVHSDAILIIGRGVAGGKTLQNAGGAPMMKLSAVEDSSGKKRALINGRPHGMLMLEQGWVIGSI